MRLARLVAALALLAPLAGCSDGARTNRDSGAQSAAKGAPSSAGSSATAGGPSSSGKGSPASTAPSKTASATASAAVPDPGDGGDPLDFGDKIKLAGMPDPKKCAVDGPFWPAAVSFFGGECSDQQPSGCFEVAQALYQYGRWACARQYHMKACELAPHLTDPPPGGGDYALVGWPQCPFDKEKRAEWKDKELTDPTKKGCFVDHDAKACAKLAEKVDDVWEQARLRAVGATP